MHYMANEVVKYHNDLNTVPMRKWTAEEMNFFFAIISKARNQGTKVLQFDKYQLAELASYSVEHNKRFHDTMDRLANNISQLRYIERTSRYVEYMALFTQFRVEWEDDLSDMKATVSVSDKFEYIINKLDVQFTQFELLEFTQIRSTYAKSAYRLLKQWRTVGRKEFKIDEFKRLMDMPKYYLPTHIDRLVIKPIMRELPKYFVGLKCKKIKSNKRGNPVIGYEFTWKPETTSGEYVNGRFDYKKPAQNKNKKDNTPAWSNPDYQNITTSAEKEKLEKKKTELVAKIRNQKRHL